MKVGFVLSQPFGHSIGTDVRVRGLLEGLNHLGVEIHLITPFAENCPIKGENITCHSLSSLSARLKFSNLTYKLSKSFMNNSFLFKKIVCEKSRILKRASSLGREISKVAEKLDLDVLQSEQQVASLACTSIKEKLRVPVIADFHGIWAEEMVASHILNYDDVYYETLFELEQEIASSADIVTVVSEEMKHYIESSFGITEDKVKLISNATFLRVDHAQKPENPSKVIHSGTLHPWEHGELFIESMPFVLKRYPDAKFYLTRKGAKLKKLQKLASDLRVNPEFMWYESSSDFLSFLKTCNIGVISSTTHLARKMAYPAKLYDYLSVGLPVVANDIGGWTKIIKEHGIGVVTENNPEAYAEGILQFLEDPQLCYDCGQRGIELVKKEFNYYKSAERLLDLYYRLA
jgi:glycosyltransferase involved in cell wall biosynthesis